MLMLVQAGGEEALPEWRAAFAAVDPRLEVRGWNDPSVRAEEVRFALVWDPEPGRLASYPFLRLIFCSGAGADGILRDPLLPRQVPIVRLATPGAAQRMGEYVCWAVLSLLKGARRWALNQAAGRWDYFEPRLSAPECRVGVMGLGVLGARAAQMLAALGFPVAGWSRTPKTIAGVESFAGPEALDAFLARSDILVCLLPDTPATRGLLSAPLFAKLPPGAAIVNAGRGAQQVLPDILAALDCGRLSGAVLDVFEEEPLPPDHPAWRHPRLIVTPHCAALAPKAERARFAAEVIRCLERGEPLPNRCDPDRGY
jgi:glyoxylate/hydroxypyruvate reductase A